MEATFPCPQCGYQVPTGTPTCGNCGNDLRRFFGDDPLAGPGSAGSSRAIRRLVLTAVAIGLFVAYSGQVKLKIESFTESERIPPEVIRELPPPGGILETTGGHRSVRAVIRALRRGGLPCTAIRIESLGPPAENGSCQSRGSHVQINVYLSQPSLRMAKQIFREAPFAHVHKDNWWVIAPEPVAERVRRILGGRLTRAE